MNPFDSYMPNKVRRLKVARLGKLYAATGEKALLAGVPETRGTDCAVIRL